MTSAPMPALGLAPSTPRLSQAPRSWVERGTSMSRDRRDAEVAEVRFECAGLVLTVELAAEAASAHLPQLTSFEPRVAANSVPPLRAEKKR